MRETIPTRHARAAFAAGGADTLPLNGQWQAKALGRALRGACGGAGFTGSQGRDRETWAGIAQGLGSRSEPGAHPGLDASAAAESVAPHARTARAARRAPFRTPSAATLAWQRGGVADPPEARTAMAARVAEGLRMLAAAARAIAVSAVDSMAQMAAPVLRAAPDRTVELQLQLMDRAVTRPVANPEVASHGFDDGLHAAAGRKVSTSA